MTIGPLTPSGAPGQQVNFGITFTGPTNTNGLSFNLIYGATEKAAFTPIFKGTSTTNIDCSTASDLDSGIATSAVVLSSGKIAFTVIGLSLTTGPIPFGRTGVVGTCKFKIASGASGTIPLRVENTASTCTASNANGDLTATCPSGTLTVSGSGPSPTPVSAQVTIGPLTPSGAAGEEVNFDISFSGPTDTNGLSFNLIYGATEAAAFTPVFKGTSTTNIDCSTASDLDPGITTSAVVLSSGRIAFTVIGLSLSTGPIPFGRTGVVGTCKFTIAPGVVLGNIPLTVENTASTCTASNANGDLTATCPNGTLAVGDGAQVTIGPLTPVGAAGQPVNFDITFDGPTDTNGISFNLIYGAAQAAAFTPVFKGSSTTNIDCSTAVDLDPGIMTSAVLLPSGKIAFTVIGLSLTTGPIPFGRTGVIGSCKFKIAVHASGTIALPVEHTASTCTASNANGDVSADCQDGRLTIAGVTIGPLTPSGAAGQEVDFAISYTGPTDTNGISFNLVYGATQAAAFRPVFKGASTTTIDCSTASDLDPAVITSAVLLSSGKIAFTVIGLNFNTGPVAFGRSGLLGTCKFTIAADASGTIPLPCDKSPYATNASDVHGHDLIATCVDGTLTAMEPTNTPATGLTKVPTATPTPNLQPALLTVGDAALFPSQDADIPIFLTNDTTVTGVQFVLTNVPEEISLGSENPCTPELPRASNLTCVTNPVGDQIRVAMFANRITPGQGQIATIHVHDSAPACIQGRTTRLLLSETKVIDENGSTVPLTPLDGSLVCACRGDANGDGVTDISDVHTCIDLSIGKRIPLLWEYQLSHVTCPPSGPLSFVDCLTILDVWVQRLPSCPRQCIQLASGSGTATVTFPTVQVQAGTNVTVEVGLENETDVRAVQISLPLPPALVLRSARALDRAAAMTAVQASAVQATDGTVNAGLFSFDPGEAIPRGNGPVLALDLSVPATQTGGVTLHTDQALLHVADQGGEVAATAEDGAISVEPVVGGGNAGGNGGGGGGCTLTSGQSEPGAAWFLIVALALYGWRCASRRRGLLDAFRRIARLHL